jgi:hypothetical protein
MADWRLPGYTEVETLGTGGFGRVVLARHEGSGALVAIKYLHARHLGERHIVDGFRREASMLAAVPSPYVVRVFDFVLQPDGAALVMEAVPGVSLRAVLAAEGALAPESALAVLKGSLLGLAAAHSVRVVHRDYKPDNVLVNDRGQSKLVDFGLAVLDGQLGLSAGSPSYMAPEQWAGQPGTPATDVYAATCVFFQCITGEKPYAANTSAEFKTLHELAPVPVDAVPEQLRGLIARGMAKHPAHRPPTADAFVAELQAAAVAGYGEEWEQRGWQRLAARAGALLAATPLALLATSATAAAPVAGAAGVGAGAGTTAAGTGAVGAGAAGTAAGTGAVGAGAAGTATAAGTAGVGAGAGTAGGGLLATATAKVTAAVLATVVVGAGGVIVYDAVTEDDPAPVAQQKIEPLYAFTTLNRFAVADGTKVVGEVPLESAALPPTFTDDRKFAFAWNTTSGVQAINTETGDARTISCGGCTTVVPVEGSEIAWVDEGGERLVITDLAQPQSTRTVEFQQRLEPPPESPVPFDSPGLLAGGGGTVLAGYEGFPAGYDARYLYLIDADDGAVRRVDSDEVIVNGAAQFNQDGSKIAFASGSRSEACSGNVQVAVIDVASGKTERQPDVEASTPLQGEGRSVGDIWWIGDQIYGSYSSVRCTTEGDAPYVTKPSVWRLDDGRWQKLIERRAWRSLGRGSSVSLEDVDEAEGRGTLVVDVGGKRTEISDGVAMVVTPTW